MTLNIVRRLKPAAKSQENMVSCLSDIYRHKFSALRFGIQIKTEDGAKQTNILVVVVENKHVCHLPV